MKHFHSSTVLFQYPKFIYLVLPIAAGDLVETGKINLDRQLILLVIFITFFSVVQWASRKWKIENFLLHYKYGIFRRKERVFFLKNAACIEVSDTPLLRLFGAKKISVQMNAPSGKNKFYGFFSREDVDRIISSINLGKLHRKKKVTITQVFLSSLLGSNAALGLLVGAPIVNRIGKYAGEQLQNQLLSRWNDIKAIFARYLPPIFALAALVMLAGWLANVIFDLLRYARHEILSNENYVAVRGGLWRRRIHLFPRENIQGLLLKETPFMRLFGLASLYGVTAVPKDRIGERAMLLPLIKRPKNFSEKFCPPPKSEQYRVFLPSFIIFCVLTATVAVFIRFFPSYKKGSAGILIIMIILWIINSWGVHIQLKSGGIGKNSAVAVRFFTRFTLISFKDAVKEETSTQTVFQRRGGVCRRKINIGGSSPIKLGCAAQKV